MDDFRLFDTLQTLLDSPTGIKTLTSRDAIDTIEEGPHRSVQPPELSVIIVAYRESAEEIQACLDSIHATITSGPFELVAIDNGLQNKAAGILRGQADRYIKTNENLGCCGGRNLGADFCRGRVLMFVDADGILESFDPVAIENIIHSKLIAVRGRVVTNRLDEAPPHYNPGNQACPSLIDAEGISLWDRKWFVNAGGFNENLKGNEGIVLAFRLISYFSAHSDQFYYIPGLQLRHDFAANTRFEGQSKQKYYFIQFLYLRKVYPGLETFVREQLKLRNRGNAQTRQDFLPRLALYLTRITTGLKFKLFLFFKNLS
ncbi:MAG: glycosyltransferase family 2 protein [Gammaproteobacteria bacterium]|nr:glycosyltransferase family 2 protein [Gammaproteobacteria bacterium]